MCSRYFGKLWVCWLFCSVLCPEPLAKVCWLSIPQDGPSTRLVGLESSVCGQGCQETNILSETVFKVKTTWLSGRISKNKSREGSISEIGYQTLDSTSLSFFSSATIGERNISNFTLNSEKTVLLLCRYDLPLIIMIWIFLTQG